MLFVFSSKLSGMTKPRKDARVDVEVLIGNATRRPMKQQGGNVCASPEDGLIIFVAGMVLEVEE
jgi:hypothetical protein